jgi:hypothetical protein
MAAKQRSDCPMRINRLRPICKTERGPTRALIRIHTRLWCGVGPATHSRKCALMVTSTGMANIWLTPCDVINAD